LYAGILIQFLLPPKPGKIRALNSPFAQEEFRLDTAQSWVNRNKAHIEDGILIFNDAFAESLQNQYQDQRMKEREDKAYDNMVDLQRSNGKTTHSFVVWRNRPTGKRPYGGVGPVEKTKQASFRFPIGSLKDK